MGDGSAGVVWFAASGFRVVAIDDSRLDVVVSIETTAERVGCHACGVIARAKDRRWVTLRDAPSADRPVTLRWRKRIWCCPEPLCEVNTWTEQRPEFARPRRALTERVGSWATDRVARVEATPASLARELGVTWSTVWTVIAEQARARLALVARDATKVGFDETVMSPAKRRRRRRFITAAVDVDSGQILDVFDGRNAADLEDWFDEQPVEWVAGIKVISLDPHEGYRSGVRRCQQLAQVTMVVDPFHIVRLANTAVTKCRQRVQQATLARRGWKGDPLYGARKLLLIGAEHLDETGWERLRRALADGDPNGHVQDAWVAKEYVRDIYLTDDPVEAAAALDRALVWCRDRDAGPELRTLAKTLTRWRAEILARHHTGASNGRVEAANLLIKQIKRSGRGFRNLTNYRLRILLAGGCPRHAHPVTRHRARPRFIA